MILTTDKYEEQTNNIKMMKKKTRTKKAHTTHNKLE